jgi:hypothetical protein
VLTASVALADSTGNPDWVMSADSTIEHLPVLT